ncbi:unnamed protein product [Arabis nemorensis]|uniref:Uncharacterized protein n=1 Tax=Arabis nemorensis TaxID=586526 RepID=A0A565CRQ5_9BRAS|nr:unnamed protein product [Arabis nemorensis]
MRDKSSQRLQQKIEESLVTLEYERLEKHYRKCKRLSHEEKDCSETRVAPKIKRRENSPLLRHRASPPRPQDNRKYYKSPEPQVDFHFRQDKHGRAYGDRIFSRNLSKERTHEVNQKDQQRNDQHYQHLGGGKEIVSPSYNRNKASMESNSRGHIPNLRHQLNLRARQGSYQSPQLQWREKEPSTESLRQIISDSTYSRKTPLERNLEKEIANIRAVAESSYHATTTNVGILGKAVMPTVLPQLIISSTELPEASKKCRGRPPKKDNSPCMLPRANSKKMRLCHVQSSPRRRNLDNNQQTVPQLEENPTGMRREPTDQRNISFGSHLPTQQHSGNFLSWRGVRNHHTILSTLDRAMANCAWMEKYPAARSEYHKFEGSDHRPITTFFSSNIQKGTFGLIKDSQIMKKSRN